MVKYFMYVRKSTEPFDRQKLSIPAQLRENREKFANLNIVEIFEESHSAFTPNERPVFNDMIRRLGAGEADGLIAWHPDRLSRNEIDGAQIIYMVRQGIIQDLRFTSYTFENTPEGIMMLQMAFSQSQYSSAKLSFDVRRGNRQKWQQGGLTTVPGPGYVNNKADHTVDPDPELFDLVKRMFELFLYSRVTPARITKLANDEWGFRTRRLGTMKGGKRLSSSSIYKILRNPLYAGFYISKDGTRYECRHKPMITESQYWQVQALLGLRGSPRPRTKFSPYTANMIQCGECGCAITVDRKSRTLKSGKVLEWEYYRCTKKKGSCSQRYVEKKELERQLEEFYARVTLPDKFFDWIAHNAELLEPVVAKSEETKRAQASRTLADIDKELDTLVVMRRKGFIDDEKFMQQRAGLELEQKQLKSRPAQSPKRWLEPISCLKDFGSRTQFWSSRGTPEIKKLILHTIAGSNLTLRDKKLSIQPVGPFAITAREAGCSVWLGIAEDLRIFFDENPGWRPPDLPSIP